ncbi:hypothetical protein HanRHA438_Chr11g0491181 [Helianthus annuus]|nr:hypothetical protein HanRHA438_Chr11g0491181 [Helianthus annuus]
MFWLSFFWVYKRLHTNCLMICQTHFFGLFGVLIVYILFVGCFFVVCCKSLMYK